nr:MAG TPA: hypothetical protein [Crassvirales sp.]
MSKLLRPKIHTYPSSTKLPNTIHIALFLKPHTTKPHTCRTTTHNQAHPLSPPQPQHTILSSIITLTPTTQTITTPVLKKIYPKIFHFLLNLSAHTAPVSDPLRQLAPVLVPPGVGIIPCQGAMGTATMWVPHR